MNNLRNFTEEVFTSSDEIKKGVEYYKKIISEAKDEKLSELCLSFVIEERFAEKLKEEGFIIDIIEPPILKNEIIKGITVISGWQ